MVVELALAAVSPLVGWAIAHFYYRLSAKEIPEWAKPIIERLPSEPPSAAALLALFQDALNTGAVEVDPLFGHVACPKCRAPFSEIKQQVFGDDRLAVIAASCPHCGWSDNADVS